LHREVHTWNNISQPSIILSKDVMVALQASTEAAVALLAPGETTVATPPPSNNYADTMTSDVDTPQPNIPRRTTRERGHSVAILSKEGHESDVKVIGKKKNPTKRVREATPYSNEMKNEVIG
jgi:hypothetical protein